MTCPGELTPDSVRSIVEQLQEYRYSARPETHRVLDLAEPLVDRIERLEAALRRVAELGHSPNCALVHPDPRVQVIGACICAVAIAKQALSTQ